MRTGATIAVLLFAIACACGPASATSSPAASQARPASPLPSQSADAGFITYSQDRISFQYPSGWQLIALGSGGSISDLRSPDYQDDGGVEIATIQEGAVIVVSQTDIPQTGVTADNYASNPILFPSGAGASDARVVVINGHMTFQYKTQMPPWRDSNETIFFRDDGTRVMVGISYSSGRDDPHAQDYDRLLGSVAIQ